MIKAVLSCLVLGASLASATQPKSLNVRVVGDAPVITGEYAVRVTDSRVKPGSLRHLHTDRVCAAQRPLAADSLAIDARSSNFPRQMTVNQRKMHLQGKVLALFSSAQQFA